MCAKPTCCMQPRRVSSALSLFNADITFVADHSRHAQIFTRCKESELEGDSERENEEESEEESERESKSEKVKKVKAKVKARKKCVLH